MIKSFNIGILKTLGLLVFLINLPWSCYYTNSKQISINQETAESLYGTKVFPDTIPLVFLPELVSTSEYYEFSNTFSPDLKEFYFARRYSDGDYIMHISKQKNNWTKPDTAHFFIQYGGSEPHISHDGNSIFINRFAEPPFEIPNFEQLSPRDREACMVNIWKIEKHGKQWSSPIYCVKGMYSSTSLDGTLYTTDIGENGLGIVKYSNINGVYSSKNVLNGGVNVPAQGAHPCISKDERFIIFDSKRDENPKNADLFVCFKLSDGSWSKAFNLGNNINTKHSETCAMLSPDEKFIFYQSQGDIYWVSSLIITNIRKKAGIK